MMRNCFFVFERCVIRRCPELAGCEPADALWPFEGRVAGWPAPVVAPRGQLVWQAQQALDEAGSPFGTEDPDL